MERCFTSEVITKISEQKNHSEAGCKKFMEIKIVIRTSRSHHEIFISPRANLNILL